MHACISIREEDHTKIYLNSENEICAFTSIYSYIESKFERDLQYDVFKIMRFPALHVLLCINCNVCKHV